MRLVLSLVFALTGLAFAQAQPSQQPLLDTGLPNLYPVSLSLLTGASNGDPALNPPAASMCVNSTPICVLTAQYDNARTDANALENIFTVANVPGLALL